MQLGLLQLSFAAATLIFAFTRVTAALVFTAIFLFVVLLEMVKLHVQFSPLVHYIFVCVGWHRFHVLKGGDQLEAARKVVGIFVGVNSVVCCANCTIVVL